jgi:hypothetical protein
MTELPLGGTVEDLRRTIALDAQRMGRKAIRMHDEIRRGVADESFDRLELAKTVATGARYAWATLALIGFGMAEDALDAPSQGPGLATALAHVAQEVLAEGEPSDVRYIRLVEEQ